MIKNNLITAIIILTLLFLGSCSDSPSEPQIIPPSVKVFSSDMTNFLNAELTLMGLVEAYDRYHDTLNLDSMIQLDTIGYSVEIDPLYYEYFSNSSDSVLIEYYANSDLQVSFDSDLNGVAMKNLHISVKGQCNAGIIGYQPNVILRGNESYGDNAITFNLLFTPENADCLCNFSSSFSGDGTYNGSGMSLSIVNSESDLTIDTVLFSISLNGNENRNQLCNTGKVYLLKVTTFLVSDWLSNGALQTSGFLDLELDLEFKKQ